MIKIINWLIRIIDRLNSLLVKQSDMTYDTLTITLPVTTWREFYKLSNGDTNTMMKNMVNCYRTKKRKKSSLRTYAKNKQMDN
jgi:hypothetical protein